MTRMPLIVTALIILVLVVSSANASLPLEDNDCGSAVDGLQMCFTPSGSNLQLARR